jgi:hypothetical protein
VDVCIQKFYCLESNLTSDSFVAGGAVAQVDPDSTGLNPAWRQALVHVLWGTGWQEGTPFSEIKQLRAVVARSLTRISELAGSSAYFNEVYFRLQMQDMPRYSLGL